MLLNSSIKQWLYADVLVKPEEKVLNRKIEEGGLGLTSVKLKALTFLLRNLCEKSINPSYASSLYMSVLFRHFVMDEDIPHISLPPFYNEIFSPSSEQL